MPLRLRKSVRLGPVRLNLSKRGVSPDTTASNTTNLDPGFYQEPPQVLARRAKPDEIPADLRTWLAASGGEMWFTWEESVTHV